MKMIDERIRDHVIVCGFGRYAQAVLEHLHTTPPVLLFVERDRGLEGQLRQVGHPYAVIQNGIGAWEIKSAIGRSQGVRQGPIGC